MTYAYIRLRNSFFLTREMCLLLLHVKCAEHIDYTRIAFIYKLTQPLSQ